MKLPTRYRPEMEKIEILSTMDMQYHLFVQGGINTPRNLHADTFPQGAYCRIPSHERNFFNIRKGLINKAAFKFSTPRKS